MSMRLLSVCFLLATAILLQAAEVFLDFNRFESGKTPPGFTSTRTGEGPLGSWQILLDEVPSLLPPLTPGAESRYKKGVLAQLSTDATDERFPLLIYDGDTFGDFTVTTRFKLVGGERERMAGLAFRLLDENNYYYIRASGLGGTFYFFKVVNGVRSAPIGNKVDIPSGTWHTLTIECRGSKIRGLLNGEELIPPLDDQSFSSGRIAFWTKSDSVTYFDETRINYTPRETLPEILVREGMKKYDRLLGLKIISIKEPTEGPVVVASNVDEEIGTAGWAEERAVIEKGEIYHLKEKKQRVVSVSMPLRDRNGEPIAAVRVTMKSFPGQTEKNALARAMIVVKSMEGRILSLNDLYR